MTLKLGDGEKLEEIYTIFGSYSIISICVLNDKRVVSSSIERDIVIYNHSYQQQIGIENAHNEKIFSLSILPSGELLSSGYEEVKIWRINENDYELIHSFIWHEDAIFNVIVLEDGKLCSCSSDQTIKIWDNNYQLITTLIGHGDFVSAVIEMNGIIVSASFDNTLRFWEKETYECIKVLKDFFIYSSSSLAKIQDNTLLVGGRLVLYVISIETYEIIEVKNNLFGSINCLNVSSNGIVLVGNDAGDIISYNSFSNQLISKQKFHNDLVSNIVQIDDNKYISCSDDKNIKVYELKSEQPSPKEQ